MEDSLAKFAFATVGVLTAIVIDYFNQLSRAEPVPVFWKKWTFWVSQIIFCLGAGLVAITLPAPTPLIALMIGFSFPLMMRQLAAKQAHKIKELELETHLKQAEKAVKEEPEKARPIWDVSRLQLELYITKNQKQVDAIFWVTVMVMIAAFCLIAFGVYQAITNTNFNAAILTTVSGVISQFIAATFLLIYKSTIAQAGDYMRTLERINAVGMSVQILDQIPDQQSETKNNARADLVSKILDALREGRSSK